MKILTDHDEYKAREMQADAHEEHCIQAKMCPACEGELHEVGQSDGPDDYDVTGLQCKECDWNIGY